MDLVLKLRELRHLRGLSQKDAARRSGVGQKALSSFETGERIDTMKLSQLQALLAVYDVTEEDFFSDTLDALFDPTYVRERTRIDTIVERVGDLAEQVRAGILERMELMLDTAELALSARSAHAPTRMRPPTTAVSFHRSAA
jgi:transcriptional regulator with XRE-family HTH domain